MSGFASQIEQDGSISSLEAAAAWRWSEAELLLASGRKAAALYWLGFTAEFRLTAAALRLSGFDPHDPVSLGTIRELREMARKRKLMTSEPHDISGLAAYVVHLRVTLGLATPKALAVQIERSSSELYEHWRPRLRYKAISPTGAQFRAALSAADWLREHYNRLWR